MLIKIIRPIIGWFLIIVTILLFSEGIIGQTFQKVKDFNPNQFPDNGSVSIHFTSAYQYSGYIDPSLIGRTFKVTKCRMQGEFSDAHDVEVSQMITFNEYGIIQVMNGAEFYWPYKEFNFQFTTFISKGKLSHLIWEMKQRPDLSSEDCVFLIGEEIKVSKS